MIKGSSALQKRVNHIVRLLENVCDYSQGALGQMKKGRLGDARVGLSGVMEFGDKAWKAMDQLQRLASRIRLR